MTGRQVVLAEHPTVQSLHSPACSCCCSVAAVTHAACAAACCFCARLDMLSATNSSSRAPTVSTAAAVGPCSSCTCRIIPSSTGTSRQADRACNIRQQTRQSNWQRTTQSYAAGCYACNKIHTSRHQPAWRCCNALACPHCYLLTAYRVSCSAVQSDQMNTHHNARCERYQPCECLDNVVEFKAGGGCRTQQQEGALHQAVFCT